MAIDTSAIDIHAWRASIFFQAEDVIRGTSVTGVQTCALPICGGGGGATIAVVDLTTQKPLAPIDLGALRAPHGLVFAGGKLYFTAEGAKVVGRYDPSTQKIDWVMGTGQNRTHMVIVSKDLKTVFTSNVSSATVSIIEQSATQGPGPGRGPGGPGGQGGRGGPGG